MRILIVDDDMISCMISSDVFSRFGECTTVGGSFEALSEYKKAINIGQPYDLICLDIILPIYSGFKVLEEIRAFEKANNITPAVKIAMVSSLYETETIVKATKEGADYFFKKPLDVVQIKEFFDNNFKDRQ